MFWLTTYYLVENILQSQYQYTGECPYISNTSIHFPERSCTSSVDLQLLCFFLLDETRVTQLSSLLSWAAQNKRFQTGATCTPRGSGWQTGKWIFLYISFQILNFHFYAFLILNICQYQSSSSSSSLLINPNLQKKGTNPLPLSIFVGRIAPGYKNQWNSKYKDCSSFNAVNLRKWRTLLSDYQIILQFRWFPTLCFEQKPNKGITQLSGAF